MTERINILVVDDHALFRRGLVGLLLEVPEFNLIGEASTGREAVELSRRLEPDVVLMDVRMPDGSGVEALRVLKQELGVRVLMLTISSKNEDLMAAIEAGADGYLLKSMQPDELFWAIRQVVAGQAVLSPEITAAVMRAAARARKPQPHVSLSPRESEVLAEVARGSTTDEIAATLFISSSTVKTHIRHILEKLGVANRTEAVAQAMAIGLLDQPPHTKAESQVD